MSDESSPTTPTDKSAVTEDSLAPMKAELEAKISECSSMIDAASKLGAALDDQLATIKADSESRRAEFDQIIVRQRESLSALDEQLSAASAAGKRVEAEAASVTQSLTSCNTQAAEAERLQTLLSEKIAALESETSTHKASWDQIVSGQKAIWDQNLTASTTAVNSIQSLLTTVQANEQAALAAKNAAENSQSLALNSADAAQTSATQASTFATECQDKSNSITQALATANVHVQSVNEAHQQAEQARLAAESALGSTKQAQTDAIDLLQKAKVAEGEAKKHLDAALIASSNLKKQTTDLADHDAKLNEYEPRYVALFNQIESLLPGAASAGLASEFKTQKESYLVPKIVMGVVFILSMIGILLALVYDRGSGELQKLTTNVWEALIVDVVHRSPLLAPLIIIAAFAYRYYAVADRMEQDYAYKQRLSATFEGYKTQFSNMTIQPGQQNPLSNLCTTILQIIGQHPARFYDKKHAEQMPTIADPVGKLVDGVKSALPRGRGSGIKASATEDD